MTRRAAPLLLAALVLLAAACGDEPAGPAGPSDGETPWGRTFLAVSVTEDGAERPLADGTTIRLDFDDEAGQLGAHAGCNHMGADLELDGDRLRVGDIAQTLIGCPPDLAPRTGSGYRSWSPVTLDRTQNQAPTVLGTAPGHR